MRINEYLNELLGDLRNLALAQVLILLANKCEESERVNFKRLEEQNAALKSIHVLYGLTARVR